MRGSRDMGLKDPSGKGGGGECGWVADEQPETMYRVCGLVGKFRLHSSLSQAQIQGASTISRLTKLYQPSSNTHKMPIINN